MSRNLHPSLEAYREDLESEYVVHRSTPAGECHSYRCECGDCLPVTRGKATERELRSRGLWVEPDYSA